MFYLIYRLPRLARFMIFGGFCAALNLAAVYVLGDQFGIALRTASISGEAVSNSANFFLQKIFTFENRVWSGVHWQTIAFIVLKLWNTFCAVPAIALWFSELSGYADV